MTPTGTLAPGVTLQGGRYVIERPLGKGGMGRVYLARDTHVNNKRVAIKELAVPATATPDERKEAAAEFQAEMQTLAALSHPNIPAISDFFVEGNGRFIVQEYVAGQDLEHAIQSVQVPGAPPRGLPEQQVLGWSSQVLAALEYLEAQDPQVIHRDIKPANLIVDATGRLHVVDFGIAVKKFKPGTPRAVGQQPSSPPLGTQGYAPHEQFLGQETILSDIYALGATMHHLLTGRDPTKAQPLFSYPPVRSLTPRVSISTEYIVGRALQNDPRLRYQSAAAMKADVDRALTPPATRPMRQPTGQGRALAVLVVFLLIAALATDAYEHLKAPPAPHKRASATPAPPTATPVPTATRVVVVPPPPTATPTATAIPAPTNTATPVPTTTPVPSPTPSVGHELRPVDILPTTSASFTSVDNMIVDGDVLYPDFSVTNQLPGDRTPPVTDIGRVAYTRLGGQLADVPAGNGATKIFFNGPIPDSAVDKEVQVPLYQHGCEGTCDAIQVWFFDGSNVLSTCVHRGEHFHAADLTSSPDPPCL
jgi:serine/threonine protein kinase